MAPHSHVKLVDVKVRDRRYCMSHVARAFLPQSIIEDESVENDSPMRKITHKADSPAFPFPHWVERPATPCVHTMWFTGGGRAGAKH